MRSAAALKWIGLALLGIAVGAAVAVAASSLVSRQIGLASEPISAGDALAPVAPRTGRGSGHRQKARGTVTATTTPTTTTAPPEPTVAAPPTTPVPATPTVPTHKAGDDRGGGSGGGGHGADD